MSVCKVNLWNPCHCENVSIGNQIPQSSCEGAEGTRSTENKNSNDILKAACSLEEPVDEDGDEGRDANGAVEQVAEGEVEQQQWLPVGHPGELIRVPALSHEICQPSWDAIRHGKWYILVPTTFRSEKLGPKQTQIHNLNHPKTR